MAIPIPRRTAAVVLQSHPPLTLSKAGASSRCSTQEFVSSGSRRTVLSDGVLRYPHWLHRLSDSNRRYPHCGHSHLTLSSPMARRPNKPLGNGPVMDPRHEIALASSSTANEVCRRLWMGGCPPPDFRVGRHFDCLVLAAREYQVPWLFPGVRTALAVMDDDGSPMTREEAAEAVRAAGKTIRWLSQGMRVLVTCFAGRNRSGLITALALCKGGGLDPDRAIYAIRMARGPDAFRNPYFEAFLRSYCRRPA
jgi:hypothetical protein